MIKSFILYYYLINLSFAFFLMSLVVFVLFIFSLLGKINSLPKSTKCIFLGYSCLQRGYRCYSPDISRYFISTDVTFFEDSSFFSSAARPSVPDVLSIPLVLPSPNFSSPPTDVVTRPVHVYTHHPCPPTGPRVDSSLMPQSSPALVPQLFLSIAIQKGARYTSNPHSVYNFLSFHRLSLPYFAFVSTLSFVSTPKSTIEALSFGLETSNG